jgi:hypothetical protein
MPVEQYIPGISSRSRGVLARDALITASLSPTQGLFACTEHFGHMHRPTFSMLKGTFSPLVFSIVQTSKRIFNSSIGISLLDFLLKTMMIHWKWKDRDNLPVKRSCPMPE